MVNVWMAIWSEVKRAARQAPKTVCGPFFGGVSRDAGGYEGNGA